MKGMILELLKSKKFFAAVIAAIVWVAGRYGFDLDKESLVATVTPFWLYIVGQGIADHGKSAEQLAQANSVGGLDRIDAAQGSEE
jgi:hypothetical protein